MAITTTLPDQETQSPAHTNWFISLLVLAGFLLRLRLSWLTFLNPDEALHYFLSHQPSLKLAYEASLTTAHPPLMILFLHLWSLLGNAELLLRLPFVIAGTLFCWVMFLWVESVANQQAARFALALFLFAPPLISLSAEIRQYSVLLLFCACSLYSLERALAENSAKWMGFSAAALYLALLTHYSALIFAATAGIYALSRLLREKPPIRVTAAWLAGQTGALAICVFLFESQVSKLRQMGIPSEIAATWLRGSIFQHGEDHLPAFVWTKTLRLFRYFFSQGTIGLLGFALFVFAVFALFRPDNRSDSKPFQRKLAILLAVPFLITLALSIAGIYPYGGTRHDVLLALFAFPGIAIGLAGLPIMQPTTAAKFIKPLLLGAAILICNLFPSPSGPSIRPGNQRRELMRQAMDYIRSLPPDSVLFTDAQGAMVLNYYLCDETMSLPFAPEDSLLKVRCGDYYVLTSAATQAGFDRGNFPVLLATAWQEVPNEATLYVFQSGWIDDKEEDWLAELRTLGGSPRNFEPNILISPIRQNTTSAPVPTQ